MTNEEFENTYNSAEGWIDIPTLMEKLDFSNIFVRVKFKDCITVKQLIEYIEDKASDALAELAMNEINREGEA